MSKRVQTLIAVCVFCVATAFSQPATDSDQKLASDFWAWRAQTGQYTGDDVTRMERPLAVMRNWSTASVEKQRKELSAFEERWRQQDNPGAPVSQQVDHRLIGSALARVRWELDILKRWQRDPNFYIEQTLTPEGEALTVPGPYDAAESREILARLNAIPAILDQAKQNLALPPGPYARTAIGALTPEAAADFMQHNVPMSAEDARTEVVEMGETPGQKISYQIVKLQAVEMLEDARQQQGEQFSLRGFHDQLWLNGNVPIVLLRWEYLGIGDEVSKLGSIGDAAQ